MDEKLLISFGLSQNQARAYRALILKKSLRPSQLAKLTGESRSNCYAIMDRLVENGLATKEDEQKKFTYYPASPLALKTLLDKERNESENRLQVLERHIPRMLSEYHAGGRQPKVTHHKGKKELAAMYVSQMQQSGRELYFIRSKADIPYFGIDAMKTIRALAPKYRKRRIGITPMIVKKPFNNRRSVATGLKRAWIKPEEYTAPVEWAISGNEIQAILLKDEGYGITIEHPDIAESLRQIMQLLFDYIHKSPEYEKLSRRKQS